MTTTSDGLVDLVVAALRAADIAAGNIWSYRDWSRLRMADPVVLVNLPKEEKTSLGRSGGPQFTVITTIPIVARVQRPAQSGDMALLALQQDLSELKRRIEVTLINSYDLTSQIQHFPFVQSEPRITDKGEQLIGELNVFLGLEFYQGPEDFAPVKVEDLERLTVTIPDLPGAGADFDLNP